MSTTNEGTRGAKGADEPKKIQGHTESARIAAHKEEPRIAEHSEVDIPAYVPPVTADVDETPAFVRYGAAVLLGLVVGVGAYISINDIPSAPQRPGRQLSFDTRYMSQKADALNPFGGTLDQLSALPDGTLRQAAIDESIEPISPADYGMVGYTDDRGNNVKVVYLFSTDSSDVPETASLTQIAERARRGGFSLDVSAYTDEHGRVAYNKKLSERRARAIGDYLVAHGVPASKISIHAMGPTHKFEDDAHDRRGEVELKVE